MSREEPQAEPDVGRSIYGDFDSFLKVAIREYYDRGWTTRKGNFIALLIASGQTVLRHGQGLGRRRHRHQEGRHRRGRGPGPAHRPALRAGRAARAWCSRVAASASMVSYFFRHQKDIIQKVSVYKKVIADTHGRYDELQSGWRDGRYDADRAQPDDRRPDEALHRSGRRRVTGPRLPAPSRLAVGLTGGRARARADRQIIGILDVRVDGVSSTAAENFETSIEEGLGSTDYWVATRKRMREILARSS